MIRERFAPSPSGNLHLGHAYSAILGFQAAQAAGGEWLLRIEDIDFTRCKPNFVEAITEDLRWLGLKWSERIMWQSERGDAYQDALRRLQDLGVIYGCRCTRRDLALSAPHHVSEGYPGTCREMGLSGADLNWRLDAAKARAMVGEMRWREIGQGRDEWRTMDDVDDVVLARRDIGVSYHLAVVVDDAAQRVTHVTRGADLEDQTAIHVLLQALLGLPTPIYRHHKLITDKTGKRLAKRDRAQELGALRAAGISALEVYQRLGV